MIDSQPDLPGPVAEILDRVTRTGVQPDQLVTWVESVTDDVGTHAPLQRLSAQAEAPAERLALYLTARRYASRIADLAVAPPVKKLLEQEFTPILRGEIPRIAGELGNHAFSATCKILTLRRMPAGCFDWEIGGFPRSWLWKVPRVQIASTLWFVLMRMHGFRPYYHMHVARRPRNRALLIEREVMRAYWRMAASIEGQPEVKGLVGTSWFHDLNALAANPHLEWLNRPILEGGGFITDIGPAGPDSGFAEHNPERLAAAARGELNFRVGVPLWPREAMIDWARRHPEFGD